MSKKIILFFFWFAFLFSFNLAKADVVINEIQLLPTGERFLELYNTGSEAVDLTGWYMQRKTETGDSFGSLVSKTNFEGKTIGSHDYFVISRVTLGSSDIVLDTLTLTESNVIQIKKSEEEVIDKVGWGSAKDCGSPCPSNPEEGKSIQKTETGSWIVATSTPGEANKTTSVSSGDNTNTGNSNVATGGGSGTTGGGSTTTTGSKPKVVEIPKIKVKLTAKILAFAGIPVQFQANAFGYSGEQLHYGKYFWNFGDGDSKEEKVGDINMQKFNHTYFYPGEYNVNLEYYMNYYGNTPDASDKMIIKVVSTDFLISAVGNEKDFFVELSNNTDYDADISNWILVSAKKSFSMPRNTTIGPKKKMIISSKITNFSLEDKDTLKLMTPQGELIFDYGAFIAVPVAVVPTPAKIVVKPKIDTPFKLIQPAKVATLTPKEEISALTTASLNDSVENLKASVVESGAVTDDPNKSYFPILILIVFVGASAGAVYFIRQKRNIFKAGDDFKILNE